MGKQIQEGHRGPEMEDGSGEMGTGKLRLKSWKLLAFSLF